MRWNHPVSKLLLCSWHYPSQTEETLRSASYLQELALGGPLFLLWQYSLPVLHLLFFGLFYILLDAKSATDLSNGVFSLCLNSQVLLKESHGTPINHKVQTRYTRLSVAKHPGAFPDSLPVHKPFVLSPLCLLMLPSLSAWNVLSFLFNPITLQDLA